MCISIVCKPGLIGLTILPFVTELYIEYTAIRSLVMPFSIIHWLSKFFYENENPVNLVCPVHPELNGFFFESIVKWEIELKFCKTDR